VEDIEGCFPVDAPQVGAGIFRPDNGETIHTSNLELHSSERENG
jgi:hypothetical protein